MDDIKLLFKTDIILHSKNHLIPAVCLILFMSLFNEFVLFFCNLRFMQILILDYFSTHSSINFLNTLPIKRKSIISYKFLLFIGLLLILLIFNIFAIKINAINLEYAIYHGLVSISALALLGSFVILAYCYLSIKKGAYIEIFLCAFYFVLLNSLNYYNLDSFRLSENITTLLPFLSFAIISIFASYIFAKKRCKFINSN
ncbi:MAG: ABC-2 transporter permease [Sarcina sp.]